ncbi:MAG: hypothetical protein H6838_00940 [Planctomycetes bacterium]|nr:hypothetical protein [Planctomycetota bacterium]
MTRKLSFLFPLALSLAACGGTSGTEMITPAKASPDVVARVLAADPGAAASVKNAKEDGPQDRVVVHGRICSTVKGLAAFTLMDTALPYCGETNKEDKCKTPWDYCCEKPETRTANALNVELCDADGRPLATPALPDLRLLDEVKVVGKLTKDEHGNFTLTAEGVFRVARPEIPDYVRWPQ